MSAHSKWLASIEELIMDQIHGSDLVWLALRLNFHPVATKVSVFVEPQPTLDRPGVEFSGLFHDDGLDASSGSYNAIVSCSIGSSHHSRH